jgi:hypothetical protein
MELLRRNGQERSRTERRLAIKLDFCACYVPDYFLKVTYGDGSMLSIRYFGIILCFLICLPSFSHASVVAECGASKGKGLYLKNGVLGDQGEFIDDGFSGSKIVLEAVEGSGTEKAKVDVIFYQGATPYRASETGEVHLINRNQGNGTWMILSVAGNYMDTYLFNLDVEGRGEVAWTNSRSGGTPKVVLMRAICR